MNNLPPTEWLSNKPVLALIAEAGLTFSPNPNQTGPRKGKTGERQDDAETGEFPTQPSSGPGSAITVIRRPTRPPVARMSPGEYQRTATTLAQRIKNGTAENPDDSRALRREYTTHKKLPKSYKRPIRFNDSHTMGNLSGDGRPIVPPFSGAAAERTKALVHSGIGPFEQIPSPPWFSDVLQYIPTTEELQVDLPVVELCRIVAPSNAGVIKIRFLPHNATQDSVASFLGDGVNIISRPEGCPYPAIHILMERENGKSSDCYVEVASKSEANLLAKSFEGDGGRNTRIGHRSVVVTYSSQDELLTELFPRAKFVRWEDGKPVVDLTPRRYYEGKLDNGFQGFIQPEELVAVLRHAQQRERSPFTARTPTRPYQTIISILHKYPWYSPEFIPVPERDRIYDCTIRLMDTLVRQIAKRAAATESLTDPPELSPALLQEVTTAALVCPGFTEVQKVRLIAYLHRDGQSSIVEGIGTHVSHGGLHEFAAHWPFFALSPYPGVDMKLLKYYGGRFFEASRIGYRTVAAQQAFPMGNIKINYHGKDNPSDCSLATAAEIELVQIKQLLGGAIPTATSVRQGYSVTRGSATTPDDRDNDSTPRPRGKATRRPSDNDSTPRARVLNLRVSSQAQPNADVPKDGGSTLTQLLDAYQNTPRSTILSQLSDKSQNDRRAMTPTQTIAGTQNAHDANGLTQSFAGGHNGPDTWADAQSRADVRSNARAKRARGGYSLAQAIASADSSSHPRDSNSGNGSRASPSGPLPNNQGNVRAALQGNSSSVLPDPSAAQGIVREPLRGHQGSASHGPPTSQYNVREPFRGHHSNVRPGPSVNQDTVNQSTAREHLRVLPSNVPTGPRSMNQSTVRAPLRDHHSNVRPGPVNQSTLREPLRGPNTSVFPSLNVNQGNPRPAPPRDGYVLPTANNGVRSNFPW